MGARQPGAVLGDLPKVCLQGAWLHAITADQCIEIVLNELDAGRGGFLHTMNLDHLRRFVREPDYAARCREANLVTADGMPLVWASRLQRTPLPERVPGSSLIWGLSEAAARRGRSVYLLGGAPGVATKAAGILSARFRGLRVAGVCSPTLETGVNQDDCRRLGQLLASANPDIVYVALGSPKEEELISGVRHSLEASWWIGVGISFSFIAGEVRRAPSWMQRVGLEWLHRLSQEPRLARRYLVDCIPFALTLLMSSLKASPLPARRLSETDQPRRSGVSLSGDERK